MGTFGRQAEIEMVTASGSLRVTIIPARNWFLLLAQVVIFIIFAKAVNREWHSAALVFRALVSFGLVTEIMALFYQISGSEVLEFSSGTLTISKTSLGWTRTRQFESERCRELGSNDADRNHGRGLTCKVGWRPVTFAEGISEAQADEILATLQRDLPDVARKMGLMASNKTRLTTLGLN